ncbi:Spo0E family sporulation regulatory protein-aspartic acid phosphatase, partial [Priestia megaterium]
MILREVLDLSKSIANYRLDMYELAKNKGFSDPDVLKINQQLEFK